VKAAGYDIQLALVGENFKSPTNIPNVATRNAVLHSSYADDIITLGYVDDKTKQKLFKNALAFVYPTKYEGFGIPVLEAMLLECPVITYRNSSLPEVGGEYVRFVKDWTDMQAAITDVILEDKNTRNAGIESAKRHAEKFTWDKTANIIYQELLSVSRD
jgi:glycosyltransferase involved in cell wall biosynthesis